MTVEPDTPSGDTAVNGGQQDGTSQEGPGWGASGGSAEETDRDLLDIEGDEGLRALDIEV